MSTPGDGVKPGPIYLAAAIMMGIGTNAAIISSGALIGQEAPAEIRGSVIGLYSFIGCIHSSTTHGAVT